MLDTTTTPEVNSEEETTKIKFETLLLAYIDSELSESSRHPLENRAIYLKIQEIYDSISKLSKKIDTFDTTFENVASEREEELKKKLLELVKTTYYDSLVASISTEVADTKVREAILAGRLDELEKGILIVCGDSKC